MINGLIEIFFIFSFATMAFSQYLRRTAQQTIYELRDKVKSFDDTMREHRDNLLIRPEDNRPYQEQKEIIFSEDADIPTDTFWYYILLVYLAAAIFLAAVCDFLGSFESTYNTKIVALYVIGGLIINYCVFNSGFQAIKPKQNARDAYKQVASSYRTIMDSKTS